MTTHGHKEESITHWGLLEGTRGGAAGGREVGEELHLEKCQL